MQSAELRANTSGVVVVLLKSKKCKVSASVLQLVVLVLTIDLLINHKNYPVSCLVSATFSTEIA